MLVVVLAAVMLGSPFGAASATAEPGPGTGMTVGVSVVVDDGPVAVVARIVFAGGDSTAVALAPGDDGSWTGSVQVARRENARVAFESIDGEGASTSSAPVTLTALGADAAVVSPASPPSPLPPEPGGTPWGWIALGSALGSLVLFGVWAAPGRRRVHDDVPVPDADLDKLSGILDYTANTERSGFPDERSAGDDGDRG